MMLGLLGANAAGGGGLGSHAYWRINVSAVNGGAPYCTVEQLEFRATVGGATQCTGGTASADTSYSGAYAASMAFDANGTTQWVSTSAALPHWLRYQFAAPVSVAQIAVQAADAAYGTTTETPSAFTIEYSDDGSTWTVAKTVTGQTGWTASEVRTFSVP